MSVTRSIPAKSDAYNRFIATMAMDHEKWRDGIGYDLDALDELEGAERKENKQLVLAQKGADWRNVEALAAIGTPAAIKTLKTYLKSPDFGVRIAAASELHDLSELDDLGPILTSAIIASKENAAHFSRTIDLIGDHKPLSVIPALLEICRSGGGEQAVHCAGMLFYLKDKAAEPFDWEHRLFFLRFNTDDTAERAAAYKELCAKIGVGAKH